MLSVKTLPLLAPGQRIILVGDIHGCLNEFNDLLNAVRFEKGRDVLILVGDLVNKGYDSVGVVERAIELGALGVLGNHDASLIARVDSIREGCIDPQEFPHTEDPLAQVAKSLPRKCYRYLTELPHILRIPQFDTIVVHAGLNPKVAVEDQNLWEILHMRRILPNGRVIDSQATGDLWATKWKGPETVVFGHDARTGLQKHRFALGLDSGCCYGGELTAYILPSKEIVQVPGSKKGITKKPPMASPETQIGFSPSTDVASPQPSSTNTVASVLELLQMANRVPPLGPSAPAAVGSSSRQTPTSMTGSTGGANTAATEALKNLLFARNPSPAPPNDGPLFPSNPPAANADASPHVEPVHRAIPLPRTAAAAAHASYPAASEPVKLVPSSVIAQSAKAVPVPPVAAGDHKPGGSKPPVALAPSAPSSKPAPAPEPSAPSSSSALQASSATKKPNGAVTPSVAASTKQQPSLDAIPQPTTASRSPQKNGTTESTAVTAALRRHIFAASARMVAVSGQSGVIANAVIDLLTGGAMDAMRSDLLDDSSITSAEWSAFISGLTRHLTDPKCNGSTADEALLLLQDLALSRPDALETMDRKALEASIMLATTATKSIAKATLIAVRK